MHDHTMGWMYWASGFRAGIACIHSHLLLACAHTLYSHIIYIYGIYRYIPLNTYIYIYISIFTFVLYVS